MSLHATLGISRTLTLRLGIAGALVTGAVARLLGVDGLTHPFVAVIASAAFYAPLIMNAAIDWRRRLLLKSLTHVAGVIAIAVIVGRGLTESLTPVVGGVVVSLAIVVGTLLLAYAILKTHVIGAGDIRMMSVLSIWHGANGLDATVTWLVLAIFIQGIASAVALVTKSVSLRSSLPFGPVLVGASWIVTLVV